MVPNLPGRQDFLDSLFSQSYHEKLKALGFVGSVGFIGFVGFVAESSRQDFAVNFFIN